MDLQFGILDLGFGRENMGFERAAAGDFAGGVGSRGVFGGRAAKLGFCIIHPAGGETVLHNWKSQRAVRTRKQGVSARRRNE